MLILNACIPFDNIGFVIKMKLFSLCMLCNSFLSCFKNSLKIFQEHLQRLSANNKCHRFSLADRVKSGIFGQTAKFGQRPCLFHISNIGIKNKLTKQTVKILILDLHCLQMCVRIYLMSAFTRLYPRSNDH